MGFALLGLTGWSATPNAGPELDETFHAQVKPLMKEYCLGCHSTKRHKGDLDLEQFSSLELARQHPQVWQSVIEQVSIGEMPPSDEPQLDKPARDRLLAWTRGLLQDMGSANAGDPGAVVLRRLTNAEYTYTLRDLTGINELSPAKEFPADSASGEGFANVGHSLVMSPALLTKYFDAAKSVAAHVVLGPTGWRFSEKTTRNDWVEESLVRLRSFYARYATPGDVNRLDLQGVKVEMKDGGILPLERYLAVLLKERAGQTVRSVDREGLSALYTAKLRGVLDSAETGSWLLDPIRQRWRQARPGDEKAVAEMIAVWQAALWSFNPVGLIGSVGGATAWMEPLTPVAASQDVRVTFPVGTKADAGLTRLYLCVGDAGDGSDGDWVEWQRLRLTAPGRPEISLSDLPALVRSVPQRRKREFAQTARMLAAVEASTGMPAGTNLEPVANAQGVSAASLRRWIEFMGIGAEAVKVGPHLKRLDDNRSLQFSGGKRPLLAGWGYAPGPAVVVNGDDAELTLFGTHRLPPKSLGLRLASLTTENAMLAWRSTSVAEARFEADLRVVSPTQASVAPWFLEVRRGTARRRVAEGTVHETASISVDGIAVRPGDLLVLLIGPGRSEGTDVLTFNLRVTERRGSEVTVWNAGQELWGDTGALATLAERTETLGRWVFSKEQTGAALETGPLVPPGSLLARWMSTADGAARGKIANALQSMLSAARPPASSPADFQLYRELAGLSGPLFADLDSADAATLPPEARGQPTGMTMHAPAVKELEFPTDLVAGWEFATTGRLSAGSGAEGSLQLTVRREKPVQPLAVVPMTRLLENKARKWTDPGARFTYSAPILVNDGSAARARVIRGLEQFRELFPAALAYTRIVPVDEVVTLNQFYREDEPLRRLLLNESERVELEQLWAELRFVSQVDLNRVDVLEQIIQFATQDADPKVFEPLREPTQAAAEAFRRQRVAAEPLHLQAVIDFAARAYRRPLVPAESEELSALYRSLREQKLPHDDALRLTLARVLVAPAFLYRVEKPSEGVASSSVNDWELANRLSYFLWSSAPDAELRAAAATGALRDAGRLAAQARRMLGDDRVRRLATEFGAGWLHIHGFDTLDEKSETVFPTFRELRSDMYEESIRFMAYLFQANRPVTDLIDADYVFVNAALASHYGIAGVEFNGREDWLRVEAAHRYARGGVLALASTLAQQSGAARTSPILRGNWISEVLLGEKLPRPPKDVPLLPEQEGSEQLTMRQIVERHTGDPKCANCHRRIDPYGFSLEEFDAIGRHRRVDTANRPIDARARTMDGTEMTGLEGLRAYLMGARRDAFMRQFCRKLLGYALGRSVQLSDTPLLDEMARRLQAEGYRVGAAIEVIVLSRQFREIRGRDLAASSLE